MGTYSVLQVVIALQRHTGYFLIQIYLPCTLLVVLSWVGFWLNREATSDRVGLGKHNPWGKIFSEALFLIIFLCTYICTSYSKNFWYYVFILNSHFQHFVWYTSLYNQTGKVRIFWESHKILRNLHLTFDCLRYIGQNFVAFPEFTLLHGCLHNKKLHFLLVHNN